MSTVRVWKFEIEQREEERMMFSLARLYETIMRFCWGVMSSRFRVGRRGAGSVGEERKNTFELVGGFVMKSNNFVYLYRFLLAF